MPRYISALLFVTFFITSCAPTLPTLPPNSPLTLTINSEQQTYHIGEEVFVNLTLTNTGVEQLFLYGRMIFVTFPSPPELNLSEIIILDPTHKIIPFKGYANVDWLPRKENFFFLGPGESITKQSYILNSEDYDQPGVYTLKAIYRNSFDPSDVFENSDDTREAWKGEVVSDLATFEILP